MKCLSCNGNIEFCKCLKKQVLAVNDIVILVAYGKNLAQSNTVLSHKKEYVIKRIFHDEIRKLKIISFENCCCFNHRDKFCMGHYTTNPNNIIQFKKVNK